LADVKGAVVVTSASTVAEAAAAAADFLEDNTVADSEACWVGEIILGEVAVKLELAPSSAEVAFAIEVTADDTSDGVVVVVVALVTEMVGSLSIVVADVTAAVSAAVTAAVAVVAFVVVVVEEGDDKCNVAFFVYGIVAPFVIGLDAVVAVIIEAFLPPLGVIGVVFFPLTESSGRPFDVAGTADAVVNSTNQTQHWIARILNTDADEKEATSANVLSLLAARCCPSKRYCAGQGRFSLLGPADRKKLHQSARNK